MNDATLAPELQTVNSSAKVIAPGTSGSTNFTFAYANGVANAPEVDYNFTVDTTGSAATDAIKANNNIQWKLDDNEYGTFDQLIAQIKGLSGDATGTKKYEAGSLPTAFGATGATHTIYWQWLFSGTDGDAEDTALGNMDAQDVTISIKITAEQVD